MGIVHSFLYEFPSILAKTVSEIISALKQPAIMSSLTRKSSTTTPAGSAEMSEAVKGRTSVVSAIVVEAGAGVGTAVGSAVGTAVVAAILPAVVASAPEVELLTIDAPVCRVVCKERLLVSV
jgi:hypothetical protein